MASKMFSFFRKHYDLIPVAVPVAGAAVGGFGFMIYCLAAKPDVIVNKRNPILPQDRVDVTKKWTIMRPFFGKGEGNYIQIQEHPSPDLEEHLPLVGPYKTHKVDRHH